MKTILALILLVAISSCTTSDQYIVKGTIDNEFENEWIYLVKFMDMENNPEIDSTLIKKGKFIFRGNVDYPELYVLHNNPDSILGFFRFYLEPAKMKIELSVENWSWDSQIEGGTINEEYNEQIRSHEIQLVKLNEETREKLAQADSAEQIELEKIRWNFEESHKKLSMDYLHDNPDSPISPYLLGQLMFSTPSGETERILDSFSDENKQTSICQSLIDKINMMKEFENSSIETK